MAKGKPTASPSYPDITPALGSLPSVALSSVGGTQDITERYGNAMKNLCGGISWQKPCSLTLTGTSRNPKGFDIWPEFDKGIQGAACPAFGKIGSISNKEDRKARFH